MIAKVVTGVLAPIVAKKLAKRDPAPPVKPAERSTVQRAALFVASPILVAAGTTTWALVTAPLKAQKIRGTPTPPGSSADR